MEKIDNAIWLKLPIGKHDGPRSVRRSRKQAAVEFCSMNIRVGTNRISSVSPRPCCYCALTMR
jgi:hypothetical protein